MKLLTLNEFDDDHELRLRALLNQGPQLRQFQSLLGVHDDHLFDGQHSINLGDTKPKRFRYQTLLINARNRLVDRSNRPHRIALPNYDDSSTQVYSAANLAIMTNRLVDELKIGDDVHPTYHFNHTSVINGSDLAALLIGINASNVLVPENSIYAQYTAEF